MHTTCLIWMSLLSCSASIQSWFVDSPDMHNRLTLSLEGGRLTYMVSHQATPPDWQVEASGFVEVLAPAPLGLKTRDQDFSQDLTLMSVGPIVTRSEPYTMLTGKRSRLDNHYSEQSVTFRSKQGGSFQVQLRAYNEGLAFRYRLLEGSGESATMVDEQTGFQIPINGKAWMSPYSAVGQWSPAYEEDYFVGIPVGTSAPAPVGWAFPALFQLDRFWCLLTEANLDGSCYAAHLQPEAPNGLYRIRLPEHAETYGVHRVEATSKLPFSTPWRVIMLAPELGGIVGNSLVHHLADPCALDDTSWILPGPSTWSWLFDKSSQTDYARLVPFIDLSAELGWPYSLVDADWHHMTNGDVLQALAHARKHGVGLTLWYNSGGPTNLVKPIGPADRLHHPDTREREMAWLHEHGVKGIKVDFMQSDKQGQIQYYLDLISDAARHRLVIFFHGSTLPRGWERTWPNLLSMESVKGGEQLWSQAFADTIAVHNTTLPFTRNVVGSMDYTPLAFQGTAPGVSTTTTRAHELATTVVFESGIQHVSETVAGFEQLPHFAWRFLQNLEVAWDDTRFLAGYPGDHIVLARRKGTTWYLAGLNGRNEALTLQLDLDFLPVGLFPAEFILDGASPTTLAQDKRLVSQNDSLPVTLSPRGGFVATIRTQD